MCYIAGTSRFRLVLWAIEGKPRGERADDGEWVLYSRNEFNPRIARALRQGDGTCNDVSTDDKFSITFRVVAGHR